jgi:hypothetical protein
LNESMSGRAVVGVSGEGVGELDGETRGLGVTAFVGVALAVLFWPAHPVARTRTASKTVEKRTRKRLTVPGGPTGDAGVNRRDN